MYIQANNVKDLDVVMPMYNLMKYSDDYSKRSGTLRQYLKDDPNAALADSESFKSKIKITGNNPADGNTKNVKTEVPSKYLSNFRRIS